MHDDTLPAGFLRDTLFALEPFERTNGRVRRRRSTSDVVGAARRMTRAAGERLAYGDGDLFLLLELERELGKAWTVAVAGLREHSMNGASTNGRP